MLPGSLRRAPPACSCVLSTCCVSTVPSATLETRGRVTAAVSGESLAVAFCQVWNQFVPYLRCRKQDRRTRDGPKGTDWDSIEQYSSTPAGVLTEPYLCSATAGVGTLELECRPQRAKDVMKAMFVAMRFGLG